MCKLTSQNVKDTLLYCLFSEQELATMDLNDPKSYIQGHGVLTHVGFHPGRLEEVRPNVHSMLRELPNLTDGQSFLNLCFDRDGNQWTSLQSSVDELITLGMALNLINFPIQRKLWKALPGGVPYVTWKTSKEVVAS